MLGFSGYLFNSGRWGEESFQHPIIFPGTCSLSSPAKHFRQIRGKVMAETHFQIFHLLPLSSPSYCQKLAALAGLPNLFPWQRVTNNSDAEQDFNPRGAGQRAYCSLTTTQLIWVNWVTTLLTKVSCAQGLVLVLKVLLKPDSTISNHIFLLLALECDHLWAREIA